ncbi:MAG: VirB3 family type IV secretion system protein [Sulfurovum sp.]|nr:VirB3 family type IV secretion system protein [Sulfurovum sp.]
MIVKSDTVFKGMTRDAYLFGVPLLPFLIGGGFILIMGVVVWLPFLLFLIPYYAVLYFLTKEDDKFFSVFQSFLKTKSFKKDKYNKVRTFATTPKYRDLKQTTAKVSIHALNKIDSLLDYIPYTTHITNNICATKDNKYISTWAIDGKLFDMVEEYELLGEKSSLNKLIRTLSSQNVTIYTHSAMMPYYDTLSCEYQSSYLRDFAKAYYKNLNNQNMHISLKFLTVVYSPLNNPADISSFSRLSMDKKEKKIKSFIFQMKEIAGRIDASFAKYNAQKLGKYDEGENSYSSLLEFFNFLIAGEWKKIKVLSSPINTYLTGNVNYLKFNKSIMQIEQSNGKTRYAKSLEIKEFCNDTYIGIMDGLLDSQMNFIITQSFVPKDKRSAKNALVLQRKRLIGTEDDALSQIAELGDALDLLISDKISFGEYHFSIIIYADTVKQLKEDTEYLTVKMEDMGHIVTQSDISFPASYFSQFPSNLAYRPRVDTISSLNFSAFLAFHTFLLGRRDNNTWGEAISILNTPPNNPYYLNLHVQEGKNDFGKFNLGNTLIIGQSGGGKTTFMTFLLNMMMKYNNKDTFPNKISEEYRNFSAIYLDKKYGSMANILACGGKYITIQNGNPTGFNPFMCEYTKDNIRKLEILVKMMIGDDVKINAKSAQKITNAIEVVMSAFKKEERTYPISLLMENIDEESDANNSIRLALKLWTKGEKFGWVFDNEIDKFEIDDNNIIGIDGTEFLDDKEVSSIISFYILWRVLDLRDGKRLGIWIDEAWKWIENDNVAEEVHNSFKINRSHNNFIIMGVQSVVDFLENKYSRAIIEQSASIMLFGNPKAREEDYIKGLSCSEEEYLRVKNFNLSEYNFLIKRNEGSVVANLDLSQMDPFYLDTLSTDIVDVKKIRNIFSKDETHENKLKELKTYKRK